MSSKTRIRRKSFGLLICSCAHQGEHVAFHYDSLNSSKTQRFTNQFILSVRKEAGYKKFGGDGKRSSLELCFPDATLAHVWPSDTFHACRGWTMKAFYYSLNSQYRDTEWKNMLQSVHSVSLSLCSVCLSLFLIF